MSRLGDFLKAAGSDRGPWNCSTLPADWCLALGYRDFAASWRHVTDPADCEAAAAGGLADLWSESIGDALPAIEAHDATDLQAGDVVIIALEHIEEAGAIWTGERLALRAARGIHFVGLDGLRIVKAWRPMP